MIFQATLTLEDWLITNFGSFLIIFIAILVGYILFKIIKREVNLFSKKKKFDPNTAKNLLRIIKLTVILIVFTAILVQFSESLGVITALFTLVGGTILGFAAMNTLGNIIAGLIVMISKPFTVGDRLLYNDVIVDVIEIKLIFTKMEDLNGVEIYIPNQDLLVGKIVNYRKNGNVVRIGVVVTPGFEEDQDVIERVLIEAAKKTKGLLKTPVPYVWVNRFQNYAVEYEIFGFIDEIKRLPIIHSDFHKTVLKTCKSNNIDIRTPMLLKQA